MNMFKKTKKYCYGFKNGVVTKEYDVYNFLGCKITRRLKKNCIIKGDNNVINLIREDGSIKRVQDAKRLRIMINGDDNTITVPESFENSNADIKIIGNKNMFYIENPMNFVQKSKFEITGENKQISIGKNFKSNGILMYAVDADIKIGDDFMTGGDVSIRTTDWHKIFNEDGEQTNLPSDVKIGNRVWLAQGVTVLKGVEICDDSVVGINSVATKKYKKSNVVIAGAPAKIVKEGITWQR